MKLLALDSSGLVASVALLVDDILVGEYTIHNKKTHSQTLLPMIADMLEMSGIDKKELDAVAVAAGPGSFTGLRIGAATAKGLAQGLSIPIVPVSSLEGLAYNLHGMKTPVCPIMDARRGQVYSGIYDVSDELPKVLYEDGARPIEDVVAQVKELNTPVTFIGDGVPVFRDRLLDSLNEASEGGLVSFGNPAVRYQRASSIALLGSLYLNDDRQVNAHEFVPRYLRTTQAERERKAKKE